MDREYAHISQNLDDLCRFCEHPRSRHNDEYNLTLHDGSLEKAWGCKDCDEHCGMFAFG
jgi:hypothetical protein